MHDVDDPPTDLPTLLRILCDASEFDELPVRHNEEHVHFQMAKELPWAVDQGALDSPHVKAMLLLQAHFARTALPMSDYVTDTKSVLDQALRVLQAMVDVCADGGWLYTTLGAMHLAQMVTQARFLDESASDGSALTDLPHVDEAVVRALRQRGVTSLMQLMGASRETLSGWVRSCGLREQQLNELHGVLRSLPRIEVTASIKDERGERRAAVTARGGGLRRRPPRRAQPRVALQGVRAALPKPKLAGWWLVMGEEDELLALKRVRLDGGRTQAELAFVAPDEPGEYVWSIQLVSDSYIGPRQMSEVRVVVA